jgi:hypothetical protein
MKRLALILITALVAAGAAQATSLDPRQVVLGLYDLPAGFTVDSTRYIDNATATREAPPGTPYAKWGRVNGYEIGYAVDATLPVRGMLGVISTATIYRDEAGAHAAFVGAAKSFVRLGRTQGMGTPHRLSLRKPVGGETYFFKYTGSVQTDLGRVPVVYYVVDWGWRSVRASVIAYGLPKMDPNDVVNLARKQQARIVAGAA